MKKIRIQETQPVAARGGVAEICKTTMGTTMMCRNLRIGECIRPCLDTPKNLKLYKISCHNESCGTCMKH